MEKYHIYEEIGKGKYSQIFKGREKKSIEYVSIKRVDKNMMEKVVNEVQIIHRLNSPHTLKFHDWYETRNNLWLILEYCAGGDLASLIKQDGHLPETSVRMFSLDILAGLRYLHSAGLLHCDLRPNNILIDEYGILKISDFKYTRKIPKSPLHNQPMSSRGTPRHMAPELFSSEGVHSFASDFWSLGCVIYELRCGHHPFGRKSSRHAATGADSDDELLDCVPTEEAEEDPSRKASLASLLERLRSRDPLASAQQNGRGLSPGLRDLLGWLLEKVPCFRCDWKQLCAHPFWGQHRPSCLQTFPPQAAYDYFVKNHFEGNSVGEEVMEQELVSQSIQSHDSHSNGNEIASSTQSSGQYSNTHARRSVPDTDDLRRERGVPDEARGHGRVAEAGRQEVMSSDILTHITDSQVKPIVNNRAIETIEKHPLGKSTSLHFQALSLEQLSSMSQSKIESHLSQVYKSLQANLGSSATHRNTSSSSIANSSSSNQPATPAVMAERINILSYLCSISSNTDAANTVLNTIFVNLLLNVLKSPVAGSNKALHNHSQSLKGRSPHSAKAIAATALALFLRYATYVEPPRTPKDKEPPVTLLAVLVTLLRDPSLVRQDPLLRHRALAALGEIVFYISAQEDDGNDSTGTENAVDLKKWVLPQAVVTVLTKALGDESDEISRHYAAKTIENVLAQGGLLARQKFCTFEIAFRMLELSQHSRNTSIQATCAMALFHLFLTVSLRDNGNNMKSNTTAVTVKKKGKTKPVSEEASVTGGQFIARVLEKSGLVGFIDSLKDGRPRLQQAYLNIFNLIFSSIPAHDVDERSKGISRKTPNDASLAKVRAYFVKAHVQLLSCLCRLVEQGSSAVVRAKAVLAVGLACQFHPQLTISLCNVRFHSILMKLVEPVVASAEKYVENECGMRNRHGVFAQLQIAFGAQRVSSSTSIYTGQSLLFLMQVLRTQLCATLLHIVDEMEAQVRNNMEGTDKNDSYTTPTKRTGVGASPGSGSTRRKTSQGRDSPLGGSRTPDSASKASTQDDRLSSITSGADILKATISLCCHPSTRRLVVGEPFISAITRALSIPAFATCTQSSECRRVAEEAILLSLEFLSQVEALGSNSRILTGGEIVTVSTSLVTSVVDFCGVCSGDGRVVVVASLRRLLPPLVPLITKDQHLQALFTRDVLGKLPLASLLADHPPVPQYTVRLLTDVMDSSVQLAEHMALLVCGDKDAGPACNGRVLQTLLFSCLSGDDSTDTDESSAVTTPRSNAIYYEGDAHVARLLTKLLQLRGSVDGRQLMQLFHGGLTSTLLTVTGGACSRRNSELLISLLSLLNECLLFLKHTLSTLDQSSADCEELRCDVSQITVSLSSVLTRVLHILVWSQSMSGDINQPVEGVDDQRVVNPYDLQQSCLNVFSLFLDLHPQHMISVLCRGRTDQSDTDDSFSYIFASVMSHGSVRENIDTFFCSLHDASSLTYLCNCICKFQAGGEAFIEVSWFIFALCQGHGITPLVCPSAPPGKL
mmetsp:Transcript_26281/g.44331  ORF Transcript_26281/g.44331 Transcript_26281/m.44331 type:complete len:1505 (+) Transcript_26281:148-4662(+)